ncbi:MAG: hypothetical protein KC561_15620, partial [Myxococcales bacterium]|nr:hypothetical protein [Myxococcales bacterium]
GDVASDSGSTDAHSNPEGDQSTSGDDALWASEDASADSVSDSAPSVGGSSTGSGCQSSPGSAANGWWLCFLALAYVCLHGNRRHLERS